MRKTKEQQNIEDATSQELWEEWIAKGKPFVYSVLQDKYSHDLRAFEDEYKQEDKELTQLEDSRQSI